MLKILFILFTVCPSFSFACTCGGFSSIVKGVLGKQNPEAVVAVVENLQSLSHGSRVRVIDVLHGNLEKTEINIWGDPGHLCRGNLVLGVGRKWVAAVSKITSFNQDEAEGDYETMSCMATALKIEDDQVVGMVMGNSNTKMRLEDFRDILKSPKEFLVPQVKCQVTTRFRNYDDHVDYYKQVESEVALDSGGAIALDFLAKSEENKDFKGRVEGIVIRDNPEQLFSSGKIKAQVTITDLIKPLSIEHNLDFPLSLYSRFVGSSYAENLLSCTADVRLK